MAKEIYTIVGMRFRGTEKLVADMKPGFPLLLAREPHNQHDSNAVAVWFEKTMVGYVKGTEAAMLACTMDSREIKSIVGRFAVTADRWPQVEVDL